MICFLPPSKPGLCIEFLFLLDPDIEFYQLLNKLDANMAVTFYSHILTTFFFLTS